MNEWMRAPFPWFGGKRRAADLIWEAFGDVSNFVDPFCGSLATLLGRPLPEPMPSRIETVNDLDCVAPETRMLFADLRWRPAGDVKVGDQLLAFDESNGPARVGLRAPTRYRHMRQTVVTGVRVIKKPAYRLTFSDGTSVVASEDHLWLGGSHRTGGRGWRWVKTANMVCNRATQRSWVLKVCDVVDREESHDAGWLGGMLDGEGSIKVGPGLRACISQNDGPVRDRAQDLLRARGFDTTIVGPRRCKQIMVNGGMVATLDLLMRFRPERLIADFRERCGEISLYGRDHRAVGLVAKEFLGEQTVVAIETDAHTFVAEGLASHNCYVANFWRAVKFAAPEVAEWADWPVNEADLHARHRWLVEPESYARFRKQMRSDPDYYDVQRAGWWVWGLSMWIGSGWCAQPAWEEQAADGAVKTLGIHTGDYEKRPMLDKPGRGVHQEGARPVVRGSTPSEYNIRPDLSGFRGTTAHRMRDLSRAAVWEKRPSIGDGAARGVHADHLRQVNQLPSISGDSGASGRGIHASGLHQKLPSLGGNHGASGRGVHASGQRESGGDAGLLDEIALALDAEASGHQALARGDELRGLATRLRQFIQVNPGLTRGGPLYQWFGALQERLRYVRVCCGDWKRVLGKSVTWKIGLTGILFDPPYSHTAGRDPSIYAQEDLEVAHRVRDWCLENGGNPNLRIALCGYEGEHEMPNDWQCVPWKAVGGYAAAAGNTENAHRERIWFSPACRRIGSGPGQIDLFGVGGGA